MKVKKYKAKEEIKKVHNFRYENHDLLNNDWTERQIILLEQSLGY